MLEKIKCLKCGHIWSRRVESPGKCPKCYSRKWSSPPTKEIIMKKEAERLNEEVNKEKIRRFNFD